MKKITLAISLLSTFLLVSCNPTDPTQFATAFMEIAEQKDIKICTKGTSTSCDVKTRIYVSQLSLLLNPTSGDSLGTQDQIDANTEISYVPYLESDGRFVLAVTVGNKTKYIGVYSDDWSTLQTTLENQGLSQQVHTLTQFFQENFDQFGWLTQSGVKETTYMALNDTTGKYEEVSVTYPTFEDKNNIAFSQDVDFIKDLEGLGAKDESVRFRNLAEKLEVNYGLSTDRANSVAKNISAYNKLITKRALTSREQNYFAKELLGVNYKNARNAILSGDRKDLDNLLETAAVTNETSPEQVSAIINEIFL